MNPRRPSESGVTLIETLIALFVIALMASAGAVMTSQTLRGARMVETRGAESGALAIALNTLSADLAAYTGRLSQDAALNEPATTFAGHGPRADGRLMVFVRNGWANPSGAVRSDLQRVEYRFFPASPVLRPASDGRIPGAVNGWRIAATQSPRRRRPS